MAVITAPGLPTKLDNNFVQPCIWRLQPVIKTAPVKVMPIHNRSLGKLSPDTFIKFYENAFLWGFDHDIQFRGLITSLWPGNVCNVWRKHIKEFLSAWFPFEIPIFTDSSCPTSFNKKKIAFICVHVLVLYIYNSIPLPSNIERKYVAIIISPERILSA